MAEPTDEDFTNFYIQPLVDILSSKLSIPENPYVKTVSEGG